ncbi:MAG: hypothetical protein NTX38_07665 [Methylobacter sp.]|nr:hypothetical protein [Methylobacter sp.]
MIAVRMCVTGHCQSEIESAVRQCAPAIRTLEQAKKHHNWDDYVQRTARYAFSDKAERDVETLGKYRLQWEELEGREIEIENVMEDNDRNTGFNW